MAQVHGRAPLVLGNRCHVDPLLTERTPLEAVANSPIQVVFVDSTNGEQLTHASLRTAVEVSAEQQGCSMPLGCSQHEVGLKEPEVWCTWVPKKVQVGNGQAMPTLVL